MVADSQCRTGSICILYLGVQLLLPGQDAGIDLARWSSWN